MTHVGRTPDRSAAEPPAPSPPRDTALPFLYTAPLALVVGGALLMRWGTLALATPWAAPTLALTHVGTLGLLTMACAGLLPLAAARAGGGALPLPRAVHVVYYALLATVAGLAIGVARAEAAPVFFAIAAAGVMGVLFLVQTTWVLGRARIRSPVVRLARVAVWSFFLAVSLGIWLAHGHGGMQFPGPRGLWLQVHLGTGLMGWVGATVATLCLQRVHDGPGGEEGAEAVARGIGAAIVFGVTTPVLLLLAQFFGFVPEGLAAAPGIAAALASPAWGAAAVVLPWRLLRLWRAAPESADLLLLRTGLGLGPFVAAAAVAALVARDPRVEVLFGWLAILGQAGTLVAGLLVGVAPALVRGGRVPAHGDIRHQGLLRLGLFLHVGAVLVGGIAIVGGRDVLARVAGGLLVGDGGVLLLSVARALRPGPIGPSREEGPFNEKS